MDKQKIIDYIEELERKAQDGERYFKLWHKEYHKNKQAIEYIENNDLYYQDVDYDYEENMTLEPPSDEEARAILLSILKGEDNE